MAEARSKTRFALLFRLSDEVRFCSVSSLEGRWRRHSGRRPASMGHCPEDGHALHPCRIVDDATTHAAICSMRERVPLSKMSEVKEPRAGTDMAHTRIADSLLRDASQLG